METLSKQAWISHKSSLLDVESGSWKLIASSCLASCSPLPLSFAETSGPALESTRLSKFPQPQPMLCLDCSLQAMSIRLFAAVSIEQCIVTQNSLIISLRDYEGKPETLLQCTGSKRQLKESDPQILYTFHSTKVFESHFVSTCDLD